MSRERAHAILKRAGYAEGGALMKGIDRTQEDRGMAARHNAIEAAKKDRMEIRPAGDDAIEWQGTHPNPDPEKYSYSHLPSDLKQRGMLPEESPET